MSLAFLLSAVCYLNLLIERSTLLTADMRELGTQLWLSNPISFMRLKRNSDLVPEADFLRFGYLLLEEFMKSEIVPCREAPPH